MGILQNIKEMITDHPLDMKEPVFVGEDGRTIEEDDIYHAIKESRLPVICLRQLKMEYEGDSLIVDYMIMTYKGVFVVHIVEADTNLWDDVVARNQEVLYKVRCMLKQEMEYNKKLELIYGLVLVKDEQLGGVTNQLMGYTQLGSVIQGVNRNKKQDYCFLKSAMHEMAELFLSYHSDIEEVEEVLVQQEVEIIAVGEPESVVVAENKPRKMSRKEIFDVIWSDVTKCGGE